MMPELTAYLFASITGAVTGVVQWSVFHEGSAERKDPLGTL